MGIQLRAIGMVLALAFVAPATAQRPADPTEKLLKALSEAPGAPGFEEPVRAIIAAEIKPYADSIAYDGLGSLIATQGSTGPRIMLDAHMDEVGGMVRRVTPGGFMSMQMLGGWLDQALPGQRWLIIGSKGPVVAVTGMPDVHVVSDDERGKVIRRDTIFLDVGARDAAEVAAMGLSPGDPVVPISPFAAVGNGRYIGKAWDDRIGCAVLIEALRRLKIEGHPNQVIAVATTQEELGSRGARSAVYLAKPDIGISIEAGVTGDSPGRNPEETQVELGKGPGIFLYDMVAIPNRKLVSLIREVASDARIPVQSDLVQRYGEDSSAIQQFAGGVPTVNLVVPTRYTHAHSGIIDRQDFERMVDLVVALVRRLDARTVAQIRDFRPQE